MTVIVPGHVLTMKLATTESSMPMPPVFSTVMAPELTMAYVLLMPRPPVFSTVMVPELLRTYVLPMPSLLLPEFSIVTVPELLRTNQFSIP